MNLKKMKTQTILIIWIGISIIGSIIGGPEFAIQALIGMIVGLVISNS
ncbi:MAG: hypothetical protein ULS35scaffold63_49 [Phage 33_17]|nr:MAG: hypothetical protein ULS35scaffold63_49 [Phage 33_17]